LHSAGTVKKNKIKKEREKIKNSKYRIITYDGQITYEISKKSRSKIKKEIRNQNIDS